jgi:hypothetical protein
MFVAKDAPRVAIISVAAFEIPVIPARRTQTLDLPHFLVSPIPRRWDKRGHTRNASDRKRVAAIATHFSRRSTSRILDDRVLGNGLIRRRKGIGLPTVE